MAETIDNERLNEFLATYQRLYKSKFEDAAKHIETKLTHCLNEKMKIKCLITSRAKKCESLKTKLYDKFKKIDDYTHENIIKEIKDLAGVRVALYFPSDSVYVEQKIFELFNDVEIIEHPNKKKFRPSLQKFEGYYARHYRVNSNKELNINNLSENKMSLFVEIQVASLLVHAWSEVEHDLVYKPGKEQLQYDELAILDSLNGLVLSGENELDILKQRLVERGKKKGIEILPQPEREPAPEITGELFEEPQLESVTIIGQNLYGMLCKTGEEYPENLFEEKLFKYLKDNGNREVKIIIADPGLENSETEQDKEKWKELNYGFPEFKEHLKESIRQLEEYKKKAKSNKISSQIKVGKTKKLKRETLFILKFSCSDNDKISLRYTLMSPNPEDRPIIMIEKSRHKGWFEKLVSEYNWINNTGVTWIE